jgi:hypothetical protein
MQKQTISTTGTVWIAVGAALWFAAFAVPAAGQTSPPAPPAPHETDKVIPEKQSPPMPMPGDSGNLSDKLKDTNGVIAPPSNMDPSINKPAPAPNAGSMPVIPPPGSPGGRQDIVPK